MSTSNAKIPAAAKIDYALTEARVGRPRTRDPLPALHAPHPSARLLVPVVAQCALPDPPPKRAGANRKINSPTDSVKIGADAH